MDRIRNTGWYFSRAAVEVLFYVRSQAALSPVLACSVKGLPYIFLTPRAVTFLFLIIISRSTSIIIILFPNGLVRYKMVKTVIGLIPCSLVGTVHFYLFSRPVSLVVW